MVRRGRYAIALFMTSLIFIIGILIGVRINESKSQELQKSLQSDVLQMQSLEMELSIVQKINSTAVCKYLEERMSEIIKNKVELGRKFDTTGLPPNEAKVLEKEYVISLTRYWMFTDLQKKQCGLENPTLIFFFKSADELSREQGKAIDYLVYRSGENITVFSFNIEINEPLIRLIVSNYNITTAPTVVIDDEKHTGYQSVSDMTHFLCQKYNLSLCTNL